VDIYRHLSFLNGRGRLMLLGQKSVQQELKLQPDQVAKLAEVLDRQRRPIWDFRKHGPPPMPEAMRTKFAEREHAAEAALAAILTSEQAARFRQIALQQQGGYALADPDTASALGLTEEQRNDVHSILEQARKARHVHGRGGLSPRPGPGFAESRKIIQEKLLAVLTPEQQERWESLTGAPFRGEIRFAGPPGQPPRNARAQKEATR
jgi:Spy/CpxP family protein refolding chaperone